MISLRKHMEALDPERVDALVSAYRSALEAMGKSGGKAAPRLATELGDALLACRDRLTPDVLADDVARLQHDVEAELLKWGENAARNSEENVKQVREIMIAVASSAAVMASRDERYTERFNNLASRLQGVAKLDDLRTIRQSVVSCATEMTACVQKMADDGDRAMSQLKAEIDHYRLKVEDYQKRGAADPVTGLANRTAIEERIEERMAWNATFCVAVLDLNGFKGVNDTYGHAAGDDLLKQFAAELRGLIRSSDLAGRWGGDEFVLVIDSPHGDAKKSVERLCEWAFGDYEIVNGAATVNVTISAAIGMAQWDGTESALDLFRRSDELMYADKRTTPISRQPGARRGRAGANRRREAS